MSKISELSDGGVVQGGDTLIAVRSGGNVKVTYGGSTTANIDGGTIDDTVIGGTTPAAVTTTALVATTADINGGTIDGTVIGGTTAAAGTFTTGQFDTSVNVDGTVTSDGLTVKAAQTVFQEALGARQLHLVPPVSGADAFIRTVLTGVGITLQSNTSVNLLRAAGNGDISFYEDTGTTAKFYWDAADENLTVTTTSAASYIANRTGTEGTIAEFKKDGGAVGSIGTNGGKPFFVDSFGVGISVNRYDGESSLMPATSSAATDAAGSLGGPSNRWRNLYLSGGVQNITPSGVATSTIISAIPGVTNGFQISANTSNQITYDFNTGTGIKMRLTNDGNLLVGTTSNSSYAADLKFYVDSSSTTAAAFRTNAGNATDTPVGVWNTATSGTRQLVKFFVSSGIQIGSITSDGTSTSYNTSSDERLKENIVDATSASDDIDAIQVRSFDWKTDGSHQKYGMVAQELMTVAPEAVSGDPESDEMMGVDYSKLVPMMLKEIQSLRARVAQLEGAN